MNVVKTCLNIIGFKKILHVLVSWNYGHYFICKHVSWFYYSRWEKSYFSISPWLSTPIWEWMKNLMYLVHEINYMSVLASWWELWKWEQLERWLRMQIYSTLFVSSWEAGVSNCLSALSGCWLRSVSLLRTIADAVYQSVFISQNQYSFEKIRFIFSTCILVLFLSGTPGGLRLRSACKPPNNCSLCRYCFTSNLQSASYSLASAIKQRCNGSDTSAYLRFTRLNVVFHVKWVTSSFGANFDNNRYQSTSGTTGSIRIYITIVRIVCRVTGSRSRLVHSRLNGLLCKIKLQYLDLTRLSIRIHSSSSFLHNLACAIWQDMRIDLNL